jgi:ribonucleotide monophosphatase NagD (HAD superfamily)
LPRYGAGAFRAVMEDLYFRTTGEHLDQTTFGKPEPTSFAYAESLIDKQHANVERIYMIGDNPATDIKGANAVGGRWKSILTLTGMHPGPDNHDEHTAYQVVKDVGEALAFMKQDFAK